MSEATALADWALPEVFERLREELRKDTRKPDQEWVKVLLLMEDHEAEGPRVQITFTW